MAKTTTSFIVCYLDSKGNKVTKNIKEITPEEKPNIKKMYILRKGKTSEIGDFASALKGFVNLETLYGPAGVAGFDAKKLVKGDYCPSLKNYVGLANEDDEYVAPKFVSSNGLAINNDDTPSSVGVFPILSTNGEDVFGFASKDDFYNKVVKVDVKSSGAEPTSIVSIKVNPSKAKTSSNIPVPGELRQKANDIRARQELKENTTAILGVVSALKDNGVNLTKEQEERLLNGFEAFVVANKGLTKEEAEAMKLGLQEDIYNVGVKLGDIADDNAEAVNNNVDASRNAILDRLQSMSKKAEQTSANDRAVNFAEYAKTRTVVANEAKRATQDTVSALKDYLASEDFAKFVAESTPIDKVLGGVEKIVGEQNGDIAYLLQEVGVNLSAPQVQRLTEAFKDGLEDSATSTAKTVQDMISSATDAVKAQMTVEGVKLTTEQEKAFTETLSKKFLEERILTEKTINQTVGKATSATIAKMDDVFARLDDEMANGFAMVGGDIANAVDSINANTNNATSGLGDDHVHLFAQGEDILAQGRQAKEDLNRFRSDMDTAMMGLGAGVAGVGRSVLEESEKTREEIEKRLSASEAMNKALEAKLDESNKKLDAMTAKFDLIQGALDQLLKAQGQMKDEILGATSAQATEIQKQNNNNYNALRAEIASLAQVARAVATPQQSATASATSVGGQNTNANATVAPAQQGNATTTSTKTNSQQGVTGNVTEDVVRKIVTDELKKVLATKDNSQERTKANADNEKNNSNSNEKQEKDQTVAEIDENKDKNKVKVLKDVLKTTNMLAEPKLPWYKRMGKFIVRHPFRSMLMGLGAGALVATGVGAIALGGFAPAIATANAFFPTIAVGGVAGAGLGAVGSVASRVSSKGRRERAYTKFMKKYKKAQKKADKIVEKEIKLEETRSQIQGLREKHRSGNLFAKVGVYKACKSVKRQVLRAQRKSLKKASEGYYNAVEKVMTSKEKLNAMEAKHEKTMAVGGYLQQRKKLEAKFKAGKLDEEEFMEDREDLEAEAPGIGDVSPKYRTGDTEMKMLYNNIKKTEIKDMLNSNDKFKGLRASIDNRNKKVVGQKVAIEEKLSYVSDEELEKAKASGNKKLVEEMRDKNIKTRNQILENYRYSKAKESGLIDENDNVNEM